MVKFKHLRNKALASRRLYVLITSDNQLWRPFLLKRFPDSCTNLKPAGKGPSFYTLYQCRAIGVLENMKAGKYFLQTLNGRHENRVRTILVHNGQLISGSRDGTIKLWNLESGQELKTLHGHQDAITCMVVDGNQLISGSEDKTIKLWNLESGLELKTLHGHQDAITCMVVDGNQLISGSSDDTIKFWDLKSGQELKTLHGHQRRVTCMVVDGNRLISGSDDYTIKFWDLKSGQELKTLHGHRRSITCMIVSGNQLISGSEDCTIRVWNLESGREVKVLKKSDRATGMVAYSSELLFSCSSFENTIKIWDLKCGKELKTLTVDQAYLSCIQLYHGKLFCGLYPGDIMIFDFNALSNSKQILEESPAILDKDQERSLLEERCLLADLRSVAKNARPQQLPSPSNALPQSVSPSSVDLDESAPFDSFDFQYLTSDPEVTEESAGDYNQPQKSAFKKKDTVCSLLKALLDAAQQRSREAESRGLETVNIWIAFHGQLNDFLVNLNARCQSPRKLLETFSPVSYAKIVEQVNNFIDEFHMRDLQMEENQ